MACRWNFIMGNAESVVCCDGNRGGAKPSITPSVDLTMKKNAAKRPKNAERNEKDGAFPLKNAVTFVTCLALDRETRGGNDKAESPPCC